MGSEDSQNSDQGDEVLAPFEIGPEEIPDHVKEVKLLVNQSLRKREERDFISSKEYMRPSSNLNRSKLDI